MSNHSCFPISSFLETKTAIVPSIAGVCVDTTHVFFLTKRLVFGNYGLKWRSLVWRLLWPPVGPKKRSLLRHPHPKGRCDFQETNAIFGIRCGRFAYVVRVPASTSAATRCRKVGTEVPQMPSRRKLCTLPKTLQNASEKHGHSNAKFGSNIEF